MKSTLDFSSFVRSKLNPDQKKAVEHTQGSLLIIAGAGSGKTRVITARIAHLILQQKVAPYCILALTFTNKAADEMKERIAHFLGNVKDLPFVGTFHSYCLRLLKNNSSLLKNPFLSILDEDDQHKIIQGIIERNNLGKKLNVKQLAYQISMMKNQSINPEATSMHNPLFTQIYNAYETEKKQSKSLDFDDLLLEALRLFEQKDFKKAFQQEIRHVLVDEYQDTNVVQHALLTSMAQEKKKLAIDSICVVGDEDQSIYSWRGATVTNIINFAKDFPGTASIKIEQNYRSVQPILEVANHVIAHNKNRNPKTLWSDRTASNRVQGITCLSEYQEGDVLAQCLAMAARKQKNPSIAILYRAHFQSRALEEALIKHAIPYKIFGGVQFYERKEIKDLFAYLRLIVNPFDRASFFRIINIPGRGLGSKFETAFYERWHSEPFLTFNDVAQRIIEEKIVTGIKKTAVENFVAVFDGISAQDLPSKAVEKIIKNIGYFTYLQQTFEKEDAESRIDNVKELLHAMQHFESQTVRTLAQFLDEVALMQEKKKKTEDNNPVLLMTLHAAKGLEFDMVILIGLEEGLLPSSRSLYDSDAIEEERRLFYVGITRAKERLLLSHCRYRYSYGQMTSQIISRFYEEIPGHLMPHHDCSYASSSQLQPFFGQWFDDMGAKIKKETASQKKSPVISTAKPAASEKKVHGAFRAYQSVKHAKYGIGIIQSVETRGDSQIAHVKFKTGLKKITVEFLEKM